MIRPRALLVVGAISLINGSFPSGAAELSSPRKIRVAITSLSGSMVPPWAANEAGIFKRYGLQVEVIATPSGIQGTNALIANDFRLFRLPAAPRPEQQSAAPI
jgi:ABC-type nitrate/sulfonate/bicarbonate transport system substrate-binding protein